MIVSSVYHWLDQIRFSIESYEQVVNVDEVLPRRCNYKVINHPSRREELYSANSLRCKSLEVQPVSDINRLIEETNAECVNIEEKEEKEEEVVVVVLEDEKKSPRVLERANTVPTFYLSKNDMIQRSGGSLRDLDERNSTLNIHRSEDMITMGSTAYEDSVIGDSVEEEGKVTSDDEFEDVFDNSVFDENHYDQMFKRQMIRLPRVKYNRKLLLTKNLGKSLDSVVPNDKKDVLLREKRYSLGYYSEHRKALNDDCIRSYEVFTDLQTIDEHHSQETKSKENFAGKIFGRFKKSFAKSSDNLTVDTEKGLMGTIKKKWGSARRVQEDDSSVWYCDTKQQDDNNFLQVKHGEVRPVSTTFEETVEEIPKIPTKYSVDISNDVIYWSMQTRYDCCDEEESPMESYQLPSNSLKSDRIRQTTTINQEYVVTRKYMNIYKMTILGKPQKINKDDVVEISDGFVRLLHSNGQQKNLLKGFYVVHEDKADGRKEIILTSSDNKEVRLFQKSTGKLAEKKLTLLQKFLGRRMTKDELELKGIYQNETIFGNTLVKLYETSQRPVPEFIIRIIDLIEMPKNIVSDGIYRTSGNLATIQKIRIKVDYNNIQILNEYKEDAEVLAGALKLFFRELKESIISEAHYFKFKDILNTNESDEDKYKATAEVINTMHVAHKETLRVLMEHLLKVSDHRHTNNMSLESISICWGQSIICFSDHSNNNSEMVQAATDKNKVVLLVLNTFKDSCASDVVHSVSLRHQRNIIV
ncbi:PREDICTED: uncharacterized protein LOC108563173 isoform X2 [Nicrophorus vespilloides]|uniref:Uncharacterized protein LOC108563173 isoform X2 n=1 Tax=Nicrophorus vespilloides TaxID=110193 RepID=A0ABM1MRR7_NICVS|nr:PREDICTED: uncharacterized protein LOC108563173 isoform X2 [Nicrophorus vespilloides]